MFGTRAGFVIDCTFAITLLAPVAALASLRLARRRRFDAHRRAQVLLLAVCVGAVLTLEACIRLSGGSGAFIAQSGFGHPGVIRGVLALHIGVAVATYVAWGWLAVASHRRFRASLPGPFSRRHRRVGLIVVGGLCFTALSAAVMYGLAFVA
jgi:hypothetical protein